MFSGLEGGVEEEEEEQEVEEGVSEEEETTLDGSGTLLPDALVVATDTWDEKKARSININQSINLEM